MKEPGHVTQSVKRWNQCLAQDASVLFRFILQVLITSYRDSGAGAEYSARPC